MPLALCTFVPRPELRPTGLALLVAGEAVRLWAVGHIGRKSRTRGEGVGLLCDDGPYARLRNPLYVGNGLLWAGLGLIAWPSALVVVPLIAAFYHLIVGWEESNLAVRLGEPYRDYCARVPRWLPLGVARAGRWSAAEAVRSERGTFAVLATMATALVVRWYLSR